MVFMFVFFFFQAEDGIRDLTVTGVQTCALPISGSLPGVSGFQLNFSNHDIRTPGDQPNVLVAMNPAALKVNLPDLEEGGTLIINTDEFTKDNLEHAAYKSNPLEDGSLVGYRVHQLPISTLNMNALKGNVELSRKEIARSKNFFALGVLYWLYD